MLAGETAVAAELSAAPQLVSATWASSTSPRQPQPGCRAPLSSPPGTAAPPRHLPPSPLARQAFPTPPPQPAAAIRCPGSTPSPSPQLPALAPRPRLCGCCWTTPTEQARPDCRPGWRPCRTPSGPDRCRCRAATTRRRSAALPAITVAFADSADTAAPATTGSRAAQQLAYQQPGYAGAGRPRVAAPDRRPNDASRPVRGVGTALVVGGLGTALELAPQPATATTATPATTTPVLFMPYPCHCATPSADSLRTTINRHRLMGVTMLHPEPRLERPGSASCVSVSRQRQAIIPALEPIEPVWKLARPRTTSVARRWFSRRGSGWPQRRRPDFFARPRIGRCWCGRRRSRRGRHAGCVLSCRPRGSAAGLFG